MEIKRVLIVDDEVSFTRLVQLCLEQTGRYEVRIETNPSIVLEAARQFQPHAVLLDVIMPGKDGGQVLAELRADPDLAGIPVMFLTATISQQGLDHHDSFIRGTPFLAKPCEPRKLIKRLDQLLP